MAVVWLLGVMAHSWADASDGWTGKWTDWRAGGWADIRSRGGQMGETDGGQTDG